MDASTTNSQGSVLIQILPLIGVLLACAISALLAYWFGVAKFFREKQLRMYSDLMPILTELSFDPQMQIFPKFNAELPKI